MSEDTQGSQTEANYAFPYQWGCDKNNLRLYHLLTSLLAESLYYRMLFATQFNHKNRNSMTDTVVQHLRNKTIQFFHELPQEDALPFYEDARQLLAKRGILQPDIPAEEQAAQNATQSQIWPDLPKIDEITGKFYVDEAICDDI